eukprot:633048-Hanusia_phi.AAC.3
MGRRVCGACCYALRPRKWRAGLRVLLPAALPEDQEDDPLLAGAGGQEEEEEEEEVVVVVVVDSMEWVGLRAAQESGVEMVYEDDNTNHERERTSSVPVNPAEYER